MSHHVALLLRRLHKLLTVDDGKTIRFLDLNTDALRPNGTLAPEDFRNGYIPMPKTYQRWTAQREPVLREMLK